MAGAIHHVDLTVSELARSTAFYERVLPLLGFRRIGDVPEGPLWANAELELGLQAARKCAPHDRYAPGLHHLAFRAPTRDAVDALHARLVELGVAVLDAPAEYPRYAPGYYAVFFADPDGLKLEYVFTPRAHPAPEGWHAVTPRIVARDADGLVGFLRAVFAATGEVREGAPAEIWIGDSVVMISEAGERSPMGAFLYVYVADVDATFARALAAGARSVEAPALMPYGDRRAMIEDAWGNTWQIATRGRAAG